MTYFELFAGVGGFGIGIQNAYENNNVGRITSPSNTEDGWDKSSANPSDGNGRRTDTDSPVCVGFSEIDKFASQVLKYHYPNVKNYGNIKEIDWSTVPDFDLLVGGSPCQDLSIAGKRAGLAGERSGLFTEYIRCLKEKKPQHFIWENVKGALSSNNGWDLAAVFFEMAEAGYSIKWQVLNAKHFGVPQNRERIFVIGTRGERGPEIFFEQGTNGKDIQNLERGANQAGRRYDTKGISPTIPTAGGGRHIPMIQSVAIRTRTYNNQPAQLEISKDSASNTVSSVPKDYMIMENEKDK